MDFAVRYNLVGGNASNNEELDCPNDKHNNMAVFKPTQGFGLLKNPV